MFVGREEELKRLNDIFISDNQMNVVIYGRRRIGKSELVKEAIRRTKIDSIYYQAKESSIENNLNSISKLISSKFNLGNVIFRSFEDIFTYLFELNKSFVFVIDEYPYLSTLEKGMDSILQSVIDKYNNKSKIKLVLLGSYIDVMSKINNYNRPLYGRFNSIMFLKQLNYQEASLFYPNVDLETKVKYYSVFGGVPYYLTLINPDMSFEENVNNLIINNNSQLSNFVELILSMELRKINNANLVFEAIAAGKTRFSDILSFFNKALSSAQLSQILNTLVDMDLINKTTPINDSKNSRRTYYSISDNMIDFYYRYIYRNLSKRHIMTEEQFYDEFIDDDLKTQFVPKKFELIAREYLKIENRRGNINPLLHDLGKYWYNDPIKKVNGEFDIVSKDSKGYIVYEVKYKNAPVKDSDFKHLIEQLERCNVNYYKIGFFSKSGFNISSDKKYYLKTLEDIYEL